MAPDLRHRSAARPEEKPVASFDAETTTAAATASQAQTPPTQAHPSGNAKHGLLVQHLRGVALGVYFTMSCFAIHVAQFVGAPLYLANRNLYYSWMAVTKKSFGLMITTMTYWWGPTTIRISGDDSVAGQIRRTSDGLVEFAFPERLVMIANHQIYTDWLYLWWVSYANSPRTHGYIYIILKESLKWIPVIGPGMMFYGFIFMSRKMAVDQPRMAHRLRKLRELRAGPRGKVYINPMWLLLFPEGTNASQNGREKSAKWAEKIGVEDMQHLLLPRSTGMFFCLSELRGTVEYVYDCTVAYEGIPRGKFGEQFFTLASTYLMGRPPKSVNFYWRRFRVDDIPLENNGLFDEWLRARWYEKDALMEQYSVNGHFPPTPDQVLVKTGGGFVETEVRTRHPLEFLQIFLVVGILGLLPWIAAKFQSLLARLMF